MADCYVVNVTDPNDQWVLGLSPRTEADCHRAIKWQALEQQRWTPLHGSHVAARIREGLISNGCFTAFAWAEFTDRLGV